MTKVEKYAPLFGHKVRAIRPKGGIKMNKYEMLYIIKNDITDEAKQEVVDKMAAIITSNGGEVESTDK